MGNVNGTEWWARLAIDLLLELLVEYVQLIEALLQLILCLKYLELYFGCMWRPRICMREKKTFRISESGVITDKKGGPRCEKHLFWDADYVCSEYRGRNIVFAESQPSRMMTWTNNTMMMMKNPTWKWTMSGCGRWIFYFGTAMKMIKHSERERGRYVKEEIRWGCAEEVSLYVCT